jgi:3-demethoxyubiquinol 3-hydroxylase
MNQQTNTSASAPQAAHLATPLDAAILVAEAALRTVFARPVAARACQTLPEQGRGAAQSLSDAEKTHAAGLMRINHVGEVCAQALYAAQALATDNKALKAHYAKAGKEEADHLAWTAERLQALGSRPSLLNPLWYAGAFAMGFAAGKLGDRISLGFLQETEQQVKDHLQSHLDLLPANDQVSRAIVAQMRDEEAAHAQDAQNLGALPLPEPVKQAMQAAAQVMKTVSYRI